MNALNKLLSLSLYFFVFYLQTWNLQIPLVHNITESTSQPEWNIALGGGSVTVISKSTTNANVQENLFYDFDTKQVNSEEIQDLLLKENMQLTEISDENLFSFSDINVQSQENNMTDSIERFAKFTIDNIYHEGKTKDNT